MKVCVDVDIGMVFLCIMLNDDEGVLVGMYWIYL